MELTLQHFKLHESDEQSRGLSDNTIPGLKTFNTIYYVEIPSKESGELRIEDPAGQPRSIVSAKCVIDAILGKTELKASATVRQTMLRNDITN
jgi:hypothetical protein